MIVPWKWPSIICGPRQRNNAMPDFSDMSGHTIEIDRVSYQDAVTDDVLAESEYVSKSHNRTMMTLHSKRREVLERHVRGSTGRRSKGKCRWEYPHSE